ncbi:hypothetical protein [Bermanella sp. R86510]|uniref:hypothetical protein n=1 Tax=unclassified Bermanella TaxID=2627862 RepID=UPI0037CA3079
MKFISILIMLIAIAGCYSASKPQVANALVVPNEQTFFEINGAAPTGAVSMQVQNQSTFFGGLEIKHWPNIKLNCEPCEVEKGGKFHPDGPTQWVSLTSGNLSTLLVSTYQTSDYIEPWRFSYKADMLTIENTQAEFETNALYNAERPIKLVGNSQCSLVWLKREAQAQPAANISNDIAEFKTQFVMQCEDE